MFVIEKDIGQVKYVVDGEVEDVPLDLVVNFASERGLLGIALDPDFANNGYVYLYWSCSAPAPTATPFFPTEIGGSFKNALDWLHILADCDRPT
jgi:hypothetical protein